MQREIVLRTNWKRFIRLTVCVFIRNIPLLQLTEHSNYFETSTSCKCIIPTMCSVYFKVLRINSDNI